MNGHAFPQGRADVFHDCSRPLAAGVYWDTVSRAVTQGPIRTKGLHLAESSALTILKSLITFEQEVMQFSFCTGPCKLYSWCWEWAQTHLSEIWKAMNYKTFLTLRASVKAPELLRCQDRCYYYWHNALNASYRQAKHFHMLNVTLWGTQYFLHLKQLSRNLPWSVYSHPDINGRGGIQTKAVDLNFSALGTGFLEDNFSFRAGSWMASGWFRCIAFLMHFQFS